MRILQDSDIFSLGKHCKNQYLMEERMKVKDLREILKDYSDDAEVVIVDFTTGNRKDAIVGSDDEDEGSNYCTISC